MTNCCCGITKDSKVHIGRVLCSPLVAEIEPSARETEKLDEINMTTNPIVRSFVVWRRSVLMVSLPSLFIASLLSWWGAFKVLQETELAWNELGKAASFAPAVATTILFLASSVALVFWRNAPRSTFFMKNGWVLALILPLIPALIPTDLLFIKEARTMNDAEGFFIRTLDAAGYLIRIAPVIFTIPNGVVKGALRIRRLLPFSSFAGWVVVLTAPFLSAIMFAGLMLLVQIGGDPLLLVGAIFLVTSPTLYLAFHKLYTHPTTEEQEVRLNWCQRAITILQLVGFLFIIIWAFTVNYEGQSLAEFIQVESVGMFVVQFIFESTGRIFTTGMVMSEVVLGMALVDWHASEQRIIAFADGKEDVEEMYKTVIVGSSSKQIETEKQDGSSSGDGTDDADEVNDVNHPSDPDIESGSLRSLREHPLDFHDNTTTGNDADSDDDTAAYFSKVSIEGDQIGAPARKASRGL